MKQRRATKPEEKLALKYLESLTLGEIVYEPELSYPALPALAAK
jgi:hypothetical protein